MVSSRLAFLSGIYLSIVANLGTAVLRILLERPAISRVAIDGILVCAFLMALLVVSEALTSNTSVYRALLVAHLLLLLLAIYLAGTADPLLPLLLCAPLVISVSVHEQPRISVIEGAAVVVLCALALAVSPHATDLSTTLGVLVPTVMFQLLLLIAAVGITVYRERAIQSDHENREYRLISENLERANQSYLDHMEEIEEESAENERNRITRDLHDSLGYALTNIISMTQASKLLIGRDPARLESLLEQMTSLANATLNETRDVLYELRNVTKWPDNIYALVTRMCRDFERATGIQVVCHLGNLPPQVDSLVTNTIYRMLQVGFTNAIKHGDSDRISVFFWISDSDLTCRIWNNTKRIPSSDAPPGIGLTGLAERLEELDGTVEAGPVRVGYELAVSIPRGVLL